MYEIRCKTTPPIFMDLANLHCPEFHPRVSKAFAPETRQFTKEPQSAFEQITIMEQF